MPFDDLIPGAATKFVGSKFGDFLIDGEFTDKEFDDLLLGKKADDILFAFGGDDTLKGGKGNDWLADYAGTNKFFGGPGNDSFAFQLYASATETPLSKIKDFVQGEDLINLSTDIPDLQLGRAPQEVSSTRARARKVPTTTSSTTRPPARSSWTMTAATLARRSTSPASRPAPNCRRTISSSVST